MWLLHIMGHLVSLEMTHLFKSLLACGALMWLFHIMDQLVCLESRLLFKGLPTCTARIRPFFRVCSLMTYKIKTFSKCFETLGAFVLFLPGVQSLMYFLV